MRLTLRNLLRFLDCPDLNPLEKAELEERVSQSDRASQWIDRIHQLRTDSHRPAPAIQAEPTPVQVARYLAGQMTDGEAIEFEKRVLHYDTGLSEVAAVHWTLYQREATEIPVSLALRQRLYNLDRPQGEGSGLSSLLASGELAGNGGGDLPFADSEPATRPDSDATTFDVAESGGGDSSSRAAPGLLKPVLLLVLSLLLAGGAFAFWKFFANDPDRSNKANDSAQREAGVNQEPDGDPLTADDSQVPGEDGKSAIAENNESTNPENSGEIAGGDEPPNEEEPSADASDEPDNGEVHADPVVVFDHPRPAESVVAGEATENGSLPRRPELFWSFSGSESAGDVTADSTQLAVRSNRFQPTAVFRNNSSEAWQVVAADTVLVAGSEVLVFSGSEAVFECRDSNDVQLYAIGPARFALLDHDSQGQADTIALLYGRLRLQSSTANADIWLRCDSARYRVRLVENPSGVEASVKHFLPPGSDPRTAAPTVLRTLRHLQGKLEVSQFGNRWTLRERMALFASRSEVAEWRKVEHAGYLTVTGSESEYLNRLQDEVAREIGGWIEEKVPLVAELRNLKDSSRQEIRLMAAIWLCELGQMEFVADYLGSADNRAGWRAFVQAVRDILQRSPENASLLHAALANAGAANLEIWYRLFMGYSQEELEAGGDEALIGFLMHGSMGVRVLAIENLREITGGTTYGYTAQQSQTVRNKTVKRQWEPDLEKAKIRYRELPRPRMPELAPVPDRENEASETGNASG